MRTISRHPKQSNTITTSLTPQLLAQVQSHATANNTTISSTVRNSLRHFLNNTDTITQPPNFQSLLTPDNKAKCNRVRLAGLTINPKRDPDLRDRLEIYAIANQLTASAVLRRAMYEYTKGEDIADPIATIDAWVDRYKPDTHPNTSQPTTLRVIVTQPKI